MAGEAHLQIGLGYSFDSSVLRDLDGYFDDSFRYQDYFDSKLLRIIEPFYGVENDRFSVIASSTARSGDPQGWGHGYGVQSFGSISSDEFAAFATLLDGLRRNHPAVTDSTLYFGPIVSLTADI